MLVPTLSGEIWELFVSLRDTRRQVLALELLEVLRKVTSLQKNLEQEFLVFQPITGERVVQRKFRIQ